MCRLQSDSAFSRLSSFLDAWLEPFWGRGSFTSNCILAAVCNQWCWWQYCLHVYVCVFIPSVSWRCQLPRCLTQQRVNFDWWNDEFWILPANNKMRNQATGCTSKVWSPVRWATVIRTSWCRPVIVIQGVQPVMIEARHHVMCSVFVTHVPMCFFFLYNVLHLWYILKILPA